MNPRSCCPLAVLLVLCAAIPASAGTLRVPDDHPTIGAALGAATSGDVVEIACGTWFESGLAIPSGVTLRSASDDSTCVTIDAADAAPVIICENVSDVRISGLTLTHGRTSSFGGGISVSNSQIVVAGCRIVDNSASLGGGIFATGSNLSLENCEVSDNGANEESGVMCNGGTSSFVDCVIARNGPSIGGGMGLFQNSSTLTRVHFVDNTSWESGGGIEVWTGSEATFVDCLLECNSAAWGGGLYVNDGAGAVELHRTTIRDNSASTRGGGIFVSAAPSVLVVDSTILGNTSPDGPDGFVGTSGVVTLSCTDFDSLAWSVSGTLTVDDSQCPVPVAPTSWGQLKSRFGQ